MPGLVGFSASSDRDADKCSLSMMQQLITHQDFYKHDKLSIDDYVCATRSHINVSQTDPQPWLDRNLKIWLDGEFYNRFEMRESLRSPNAGDPEILATLFRNGIHDENFDFLRQINGIYSAVVYDGRRRMLYLVSDRFGLRHLYWTVCEGRLAWASEYKAFLALSGFQPRIDTQTVRDFFEVGHCLEDRTWFVDVKLLSPGCVLVWDLRRGEERTVRYWGWDQIRPISGSIDEAEIIEELGRRFRQAVERCCHPNERVGLQLSGGLDSRALLAAIPARDEQIHAFTFGIRGCDDLRLAQRAAKVRGAVHHFVEIDAGNWFNGRSDAVWWLDGQKNLLDMHCLHSLSCSNKFFDIHLSGYLGGNTVGGEYLSYKGQEEINVINNRGRRFIWGGLRLGLVFHEERPVFFDNDFIIFAMAIPKSLRQNSYIYNKMLLSYYPKYFSRIPWQTTGCPIAWPTTVTRTAARLRWFRYKLSHRLRRYNINFQDHSSYTDYDLWLRQEPARSTFVDLLFDRHALYPEYTEREKFARLWKEHQRGADWAERLCRYATFELWLRQVFCHEFRPNGISLSRMDRADLNCNDLHSKTHI